MVLSGTIFPNLSIIISDPIDIELQVVPLSKRYKKMEHEQKSTENKNNARTNIFFLLYSDIKWKDDIDSIARFAARKVGLPDNFSLQNLHIHYWIKYNDKI